jgi:predicted unusual protein kinase regulating ubiquinone biosynthesis (AarF/ABC1/UbiB family)
MLSSLLKIPILKLKYKFLPNEAQTFWAQELIESQGLGAKLGQVLAQGKNYKLPKASIKNEALKKIFRSSFEREIVIEEEALAASMGQVFLTKIDGEDHAIKVLHPKIRAQLEKEVENIMTLGNYYAKAKNFSFNKEIFSRFLNEIIEEETDLKREAHFQEQFGFALKDRPEFIIPKVVKSFSNENFLTQQRVDCKLAKDQKSFSNYNIFDFFFKSLLSHGLLHGDLNDRNWGIDNQNRVVVYDFGCSQYVTERRTNGLKKLLLNQNVVDGFKEIGLRLEATFFKGKEQALRDDLFKIFLMQEIPADYSYSEDLQGKYGDDIKKLREYTDPWILLLMRSLFSLIRIYQSRNQCIPLLAIIKPYMDLKEDDMKSKNIKIEVTENYSMVVSMSLPITAIDNLEDLMPEKVATKITEEKINLNDIIKKVKDSQFVPQDLFKLEMGNRKYRVWIE